MFAGVQGHKERILGQGEAQDQSYFVVCSHFTPDVMRRCKLYDEVLTWSVG